MKQQNNNLLAEFTWMEKILFYLLYAFVRAVSLLPMWMLYILSDGLYFLIYYIAGYRKKIVRKNLKDSFPDKDSQELMRIEHAFYHWFCDYIYETIKLSGLSRKEMRRRVTYSGHEPLNELFRQGKSVALYMGHYCNWEWITGITMQVPDDVKVKQVYHVLENKVFDALLLKIRSRMGAENISMRNTMRHVILNQRNGTKTIWGFISDQVPLYQSAHYFTDFLNHPDTMVITGTERLAKQVGYACVYLDIRRVRRGYYHAEFIPMVAESKDVPDWDITKQYFQLLEKTIQRQPEFWLWTHNRWKRNKEGWEEYNRLQNKTHNRTE